MSATLDDKFDLFPEEEWYEVLIRYGLYVGAAFQILCILAIVVFPPSSSDQAEESQSGAVTNFLSIRFNLKLKKNLLCYQKEKGRIDIYNNKVFKSVNEVTFVETNFEIAKLDKWLRWIVTTK